METTRGYVTGRKREMRYILIFNPQEQGKTERKYGTTEELNLKLVAKYPASKARQRDEAKTTNQKNRLEVVGYSIVVIEDIVIVT